MARRVRIDGTSWWQGLAPAERRTLRKDPGRPPPGIMARFVEPGEADEHAADGMRDRYEYFVAHEMFLVDGPAFRICSAHPEARAAVAGGHLAAGFRCPLAAATCPMRSLLSLAPGCDVRFEEVTA